MVGVEEGRELRFRGDLYSQESTFPLVTDKFSGPGRAVGQVCLHLCVYDTIRDAILTCARKPTRVSLIYRMELTTKNCKNRKTKSRKQICSEITVSSLGNPCSDS